MELKTRDMLGEVELVNDRMYDVWHSKGEYTGLTRGKLETYTMKGLTLDISTKYNGRATVIIYDSIVKIEEAEDVYKSNS